MDRRSESYKEKKRIWARAYYKTDEGRAAHRESIKRYRRKHPERTKDAQLRHDHGIDIGRYREMFNEQGGFCAICGTPPGKRRLAVDHDHKTGKIRGLLCINCNLVLGYAREDTGVLLGSIRYLKKHREL